MIEGRASFFQFIELYETSSVFIGKNVTTSSWLALLDWISTLSEIQQCPGSLYFFISVTNYPSQKIENQTTIKINDQNQKTKKQLKLIIKT